MTFAALPGDAGRDRAIDDIAVSNERTGVVAVEAPAAGSMTDHPGSEAVFEQARQVRKFLCDEFWGIFGCIWAAGVVIFRNRLQRRSIPWVHVSADFGGAVTHRFASELGENGTLLHVEIGEVGGTEAVFFAQFLETRDELRILGRDGDGRRPEVVTLGVDGNEECGFHPHQF